jgi:SAM-dependent methyltransferase
MNRESTFPYQAANKERVSFDDYAETYKKEIQSSINFIGKSVDFFLKLKADKLVRIAQVHFGGLSDIRVLDIGCGIGLMDTFLADQFQNFRGVDVEPRVIEKASARNPGVAYQMYDGKTLPFPNASVDLAFAVNVIHHITPGGWENFMREMYRVVSKDGLALMFEHNPLNPLTRTAVARCRFDRDAVLLRRGKLLSLFSSAGFEVVESAYIVFLPFDGMLFRKVEELMGWIPLGGQYYVAGKKREK